MRNDFAIIKELGYTNHNGLCVSLDDAKNNTERLYLDEAFRLGVTAVFFRRFYKEKEDSEFPFHSEPAVCIFNKTESFFNSKEHKELHAALWSEGKVEIYIIQSSTRIDIINARKPAKRISNENLEIDDSLLLASEALDSFDDHRFSAHLFGSGTFWEQSDFIEEIDGNSSPYIFLLDYLMQVRRILSEAHELNLKASTLDKLLVVCILVKFLEEIKDDNGKHTLRKIYKTYNVSDFTEALEQKLCVKILNSLSTEFNGKIFDTFSGDEKNKLENADLTLISQFLRANINLSTNQYFIWEQFSFKHLPAEVISAIYENFIQAEALRKNGKTEKGVVYTPIHLVNLLVDEAMPLEDSTLFKNDSFKILDPACGSGVFLVAAYKRLLQWWTINNSQNGLIKYPNKKVAQKILEDNIFGVDIEETATLVSIFGLTTALLDKLTPKEIWDNLKFKNLKERNIQENSFFTWAQLNEKFEKDFDLVIGNPPFNPPSGVSKKDVVSNQELSLFGIRTKDIPNNNLALKFLEGALYFGKRICLIIPANVILYNKANSAQKYRSRIFTDFTISKIYDFTHLRETLFTKKSSKYKGLEHQKKSGRTPVVGLFINNKPSSQESIEHIVVKRELFIEKKIRFEIDYYDRHKVQWNWAIARNKQFIWKSNLLGGGRLFHLIYRLSLLRNLKEFIQERKKENPDWLYRSGYKIGGKTVKKYASFVEEGDKIINLRESGTYEVSKEGEKTNLFESFPQNEMYVPPFIIFGQILGLNNIPVALIEKYSHKKYLYFNRDYIGISAPRKHLADLRKLFAYVQEEFNSLYQLYVLSTSSNCLVLHETAIRQADISSIPFPENKAHLVLTPSEKVIQNDVLKYYRHFGKAISKGSAGEVLHKKITKKELQLFGKAFCVGLNKIYSKNNKSWQSGQIVQTPSFIFYQFGFGKNNGLECKYSQNSQKEYSSLMENIISNTSAIYHRIIRFYKHENGYDCVYLIKPNTKRYWLKSIALRDADDTFMDLKKAGF